ncbi:MAG: hypothetical protein LH467_09230 [Gemmatimonadaceae bacterium]|nr:hypothetical protein [Gemmatimonadaceae bacterium]
MAQSILPPAIMLLTPKYLPRLAAIVGLFTRYGLRDLAKQQGLITRVPSEGDVPPDEIAQQREHAEGYRKRLVELGPAHVKLGQLLSTRPDLLPDPCIQELEKLQDDVGPISLDDVERTIEDELGGRISKLFDFFDPEPLGTASLGQVHGARMRGGREVVVKVQRPNIRASLAEELDYRTEARNAATFRKSLAPFPRIMVPKVIEAYSSERVLTSERVHGVKVDVAATLIEQNEPTKDFDRAAYTREIATLVSRNVDLSAAEVQAGKVLFEVIDLSIQHGLRLPAEMTLLAKALFNLDGVTRSLDPAYTPPRHDSRLRQRDRDEARNCSRTGAHLAPRGSSLPRWSASTWC